MLKLMELHGSTAAATSFIRMLFAFLIMTAFTAIKFGPKALIIDKQTLVTCAVLGVVQQYLQHVLHHGNRQCRHRRFSSAAKHCTYFYYRVFDADIP